MKPTLKSPTFAPLLLAIVATVSSSPHTIAADVTWDIAPGSIGAGDSTITGGGGTWNAVNGNWTTDAGATNVAWNNDNNDVALFGETGGAVSLGQAITAGGIRFNADAYSVSGNVLTLGGATPNITVASTLTATISSEIAGTAGYTVGTATTGTGTLNLAGANSYSGVTTVNFGTLNIQNDNAFGSTVGGIADGTVLAPGTNTASLSFPGSVNILNEPLTARGGGVGNVGGLRNLSGNNSWTGDITLSNSLRVTSDNGTLTLGNIDTQPTAAVRTLIVNGAGNVVVNGVVGGTGVGAGGVVSVDNFNNVETPGTLTLNGADTYAGNTSLTGGGTLNLAGPRTLPSNNIIVTHGILNMSGARTGSAGTINLGNGNGHTATLNLSNGDFTAAALTVGTTVLNATTEAPGIGIVNHSEGILLVTGQILMGTFNTSSTLGAGTGTYNLSGGALRSSNATLAALCIGTQTGGTATFNLSGTGLLEMTGVGGLLQIGRSSSTTESSSGTFNQTGGTASVLNVAMGNASNSNTTSVLNLAAGTFTASTAFTAMAAGAGSTASIFIGGTADVTLPPFPVARGSGSTASITFNGGVLRPSSSSLAYMSGLDSATIQNGGATFDVADGIDITISQDLLTHGSSLGGGLTKLGDGTLTLSGASTYTGSTTVTAGTLAVDGSLVPASPVSIGANATLGGTGNIGGIVGSSGTIAPGNNGIGTLTTGTATLSAGTVVIKIAGSNADRLVSTGTLNLAGATLTVTPLASASVASFVIAEGVNRVGAFATPSLPAGYSLDYTPTQVILNTGVSSGYETWALDNGIDGEPATGDFDHDGLSNIVEYALGLDPKVSSVPAGTFNGNLLTFTKGAEAMANGDVLFEIEQSTTLSGWTVVVQNDPLLGSISHTLPSAQPKVFARLKITRIP